MGEWNSGFTTHGILISGFNLQVDGIGYRWSNSGVDVTSKRRVRFIHCDEQVGVKSEKNA